MPHMIMSGPPSSLTVTGTMIEILDILGQRLHFCYKFITDIDATGGSLLENGSWTGMMKLIVSKKIAFVGSGLIAGHIRAKKADFTEYLYMDEWAASYQRPKFQSDIIGFIKPFTYKVWLFVALALFVVWSASYMVRLILFTVKIAGRSLTDERNTSKIQDLPDVNDHKIKTYDNRLLYESCVWTAGSLLGQAIPKLSNGESVRFLTGIWLLISFILASVYRSNLKAMLILPRIQLPFDNMEELIETGLPVWVPKDTMFHLAAKNAPSNTNLGKIKYQFVGDDVPINLTWGISGMLRGEHVISGPLSAIMQIIHGVFSKTGVCPTYVMSERFLKTSAQSFALPKNSPWTAKLNPLISRLRESGILNHIYLKGVLNATECLKPITNAQGSKILRPMDLGDFYGILFVYSGGILFVFMTFVVEIMVGGTNTSEDNKANTLNA